VSGGLAVAQSNQPIPSAAPAEQPVSWLDALWNLPVLRWFSSWTVSDAPKTDDEQAQVITVTPAPEPALPPCSVEPLPAVTDPEALDFEAKSGSPAVVNTSGLTSATNRALGRFQELVTKAGGEMYLTSAFRPAAYQQHLQSVWYKWMDELRNNNDPACAALKAQVGDEFTRHQLLPSQHPVAVSDHTLGIGFDAAIELPAAARVKGKARRRVTLDRIARLAGMMRPDIRRDPVHFRLIGGRA
jgi:hypothetical protein